MNSLGSSEVLRIDTFTFIDTLTTSFKKYIEQNAIEKHPSIFVQGQPGIGKSQSIVQISRNLEKDLKKRVIIKDIRLFLFNPVDLRGIPVADMDKKTAVWLIPEIFTFDKSNEVVNILFLDELTSAPSSLQAAAYQIALDRRLGEHTIPNNTFIIAAGNRIDDSAIVYDMPAPLKNRFIHFELEINFKTWLKWAKENNIHSDIIDFLQLNPDKLSTNDFSTQDNIIVTPRSWETLSNIMYVLKGDLNKNRIFVSSIVGNSLTSLMLLDEELLPIEEILEGRYLDAPKSMSELQRIIGIIENQIEEYVHNEVYMSNILNFMQIIPIDYGIRLFRRIIRINIEEYDITKVKGYQIFIKKLGELDE